MQPQHIDPCEYLLPFPQIADTRFAAADRLLGLNRARILLVDNGRMQHPPYATAIDAFGEVLHECRVTRLQLPLLAYTLEQVRERVDALAGEGYDAAVIGLAESGVAQATAVFAVELERLGIPTLLVCAEPGVSLARAIGAREMTGLQVLDLGVRTSDTSEQARALVLERAPRIRAALSGAGAGTADGEELVALVPPADAVIADWQRAAAYEDRGLASIEFLRSAERHGIGDGLPIVPPTARLVEGLLERAGEPGDAIVVSGLPPSGQPVTVLLAAVNAVMAGCEPAQFPVVLAALRAMAQPAYRLHQCAISTHPGANLILVSGPLAQEARISSGAGCLGPGQRANLAVGRATNLCLMNVLRSVPGLTDLATHGSAAELALCFADHPFGSWPALHEVLGAPAASTVTVHRCAPPHNVMDLVGRTPAGLVESLAAAAASIAFNNAYCPSDLLVILSPDHARLFQLAGWSRADLQQCLWDKARNPRRALAGRGIENSWPASFASLDPVPVVPSPEDILVAVAGGPGPHSQVAVPWGFSRASTRVVGDSISMGAATGRRAAPISRGRS